MKKNYKQPILEICVLEAGVICDGDAIFNASPGNHGQQVTPITAPKRNVFY